MSMPIRKPTKAADAQSMPPLAWPEEWDGNLRGSRRRSIKLFAIFVVLALISAFATTPTMFVTTAAPALILLNFTVTSYLASHLDLRRTTNRVSQQRAAKNVNRIFIPTHRWYKALYHLTHIAALALAIQWIYLGATIDYDGRRAFFVYVAAFTFGPALAIWALARLSSRLLFRVREPKMGLAIGKDGISQISWWGETHIDWSLIKEIYMTRARGPKMFGRGHSPTYVFNVGLPPTEEGRKRLRGHFPRLPVTNWPLVAYRARMIDVAELDIYPPVVPHLLKFYFDHPELRGELGTEKALERIRTGNFVA